MNLSSLKRDAMSNFSLRNGFLPLLGFLVFAIAATVFLIVAVFEFKSQPLSEHTVVNKITEDPQVINLGSLATSDQTKSIENDLKSTNLDQIDKEMSQVSDESNGF